MLAQSILAAISILIIILLVLLVLIEKDTAVAWEPVRVRRG